MKILLFWKLSNSNCLLDKYLTILFMKQYFNFEVLDTLSKTPFAKSHSFMISSLFS